jgi:hypothetical protein
MNLYRTSIGPVVGRGDAFYRIADSTWNQLLAREELSHYLAARIDSGQLSAIDQPR